MSLKQFHGGGGWIRHDAVTGRYRADTHGERSNLNCADPEHFKRNAGTDDIND